jgi:hypothetical protein
LSFAPASKFDDGSYLAEKLTIFFGKKHYNYMGCRKAILFVSA